MTNSNDRKRIDLRLRLQSYEDTSDGILLSYLSDKGSRESRDLIWQMLRMGYLPFAYRENGDLSAEDLRIIVLEACSALEKHISHIRMAFCIENPTLQMQPMMNGQNYLESQVEPLPESKPKKEPIIKGVASKGDMKSVFGDM